MEGARFAKVEARRRDLRWPLPKDFAARLEGKTVTGLGRRAKYLLVDLSSGDVLLMHLGMSGSFRVQRRRRRSARRAAIITSARSTPRTITSCSTCRIGARSSFNDPRRFGIDEAGAARRARAGAALARARARAARQRIRRRHAGARLQGQEDEPQGRAVRSAGGGRARQHLCLRGAAPRAAVAQAPRLHDRDRSPARRTSARRRWWRRSAPCSRMRSRPAALRCAITGAPTASSACSSTISASTTARAKPCPTPGCNGTIKRIVQTGRSTFFCPVCQK